MNESIEKWLVELTESPSTAIQKLVLGYAGVPAWSRSSLRESLVEIFQTHAEPLDAAIDVWLQERLMKLPPERTPTLVWASHLQDLFSAVAGLPLPRLARLLRERMSDFRSWLHPLLMEEGIDPEAAYLAALAWGETNQYLEGMWRALAQRRGGEPAYYTDIGLLGLRKLRDERGRLPEKAPMLLLVTLLDLTEVMSQKDWLLTTRAMLGGYHYSLETWAHAFEPLLEARSEPNRAEKWLRKILPLRHTANSSASIPIRRPQFTLNECDWFVNDVGTHGPRSGDKRLESFLESHRGYASATNEVKFLSKTFNRLAEAAKKHDPSWAVARAQEALQWSNGDPVNWTVLARCLWARAKWHLASSRIDEARIDFRQAYETLWTARFHMPQNKYFQTELARLHREAGDLATAEALYREASAEFPMEHAPLCGLAEVLAERGRTKEAEEIYRNAIEAFPDTPVPRDGLAALLHKIDRTPEAEELYRKTSELYLDDDRSRTALGDLLFRQSAEKQDEFERDEAHRYYREASFLGSRFAQARLANFDARWKEFSAQLPLIEIKNETLNLSISIPDVLEMGPAQRLGRALLRQWEAGRAESADERDRFFGEAEALLGLPDELTGECHMAFVEARGFLLLARERALEARKYFEQKLAIMGRRSLGLRLGLAEARVRLGEVLTEAQQMEFDSFGPEGSILPLILKVVRQLEIETSDDVLLDLLLDLYPRVRELAGMPACEMGEDYEPAEPVSFQRPPETPDTMIAHLLVASVFRPAGIEATDDLQEVGAIGHVRDSLNAHRHNIFSVIEKLALAA